MTDPVFIRSASDRDLAAVQKLLTETWHDTYDHIYGRERVAEITAEWHSVPALAARLRRPRAEFLVADTGAAIVGMAFAAEGGDPPKAMLHQLYVLPSFQRRGTGAALLKEIEESFPEAHSLRVEVEQQNGNAMRFYRKHGFQQIAEEAPGEAVARTIPVLAMEKPLG